MALITDFYAFLISVVFISLSGVLLPGPLFAITLKKAAKRPAVGALISIGHGMIELPLMLLIYFALDQFAAIPVRVEIAVGLSGGLFMILMGIQTYRNRNRIDAGIEGSKQDTIVAGIWATAANAGFILWWLTVGSNLILLALELAALAGVVFMFICHVWMDYVWLIGVSYFAKKGINALGSRWYQMLLGIFGVILIVFGISFFGDAILW